MRAGKIIACSSPELITKFYSLRVSVRLACIIRVAEISIKPSGIGGAVKLLHGISANVTLFVAFVSVHIPLTLSGRGDTSTAIEKLLKMATRASHPDEATSAHYIKFA